MKELIDKDYAPGTLRRFEVLERHVSTFHHCHPSGELVPSTEDCSLTHKLKAGGKLLDLDILDHLIISRDGYYSFGDEGIL